LRTRCLSIFIGGNSRLIVGKRGAKMRKLPGGKQGFLDQGGVELFSIGTVKQVRAGEKES